LEDAIVRTMIGAGLVSLIALLAGCADGETATEATAPASATPTDETTAPATSDSSAESDESTTAPTDAAETSSTNASGSASGGLAEQLFAAFGVEPSDEVLQCMTDRGVNLNASPTADQAQQEVVLAVFTCAPEELAASAAAEAKLPAGVDQEQFQCVAASTFRYLGALPVEEALVTLESDIPDELRATLVPQLAEECGLTEEQADAALDS
jgi:hypothetical protein